MIYIVGVGLIITEQKSLKNVFFKVSFISALSVHSKKDKIP